MSATGISMPKIAKTGNRKLKWNAVPHVKLEPCTDSRGSPWKVIDSPLVVARGKTPEKRSPFVRILDFCSHVNETCQEEPPFAFLKSGVKVTN